MTLLFQCHREVPPCLVSLDRNENLDGTGRRAWETGQNANPRSTLPVPTLSVQGEEHSAGPRRFNLFPLTLIRTNLLLPGKDVRFS